MRQAGRFLFRPSVFFNQLQWSSSHWFIVAAFLAIATVETQLGHYTQTYFLVSETLRLRLGLSETFSLWIITFVKLLAMIGGTYLISTLVWYIGNLIGSRRSKRVLFRRLAVVFTVLLLGRTVSHLVHLHAQLEWVSYGMYAWGTLLGYLAVKEQFMLGFLETVVVCALGIIVTTVSLRYGTQYSKELAINEYHRVNSELNRGAPATAAKMPRPRKKSAW